MWRSIVRLLFLAVCRAGAVELNATNHIVQLGAIELNATNHIVLLGAIDDESVDSIEEQLCEIPAPRYMYIDSPGGDVASGLKILRMVRALQNLTCVVDNAYSMAFAILQSCHTRLILDTGSAMQHQMNLRGTCLSSDLGRVKSHLRFVEQQSQWLLGLQARRLGVTTQWLENRTRDEWWLFGAHAVDAKCADGVVADVRCAPSFNASECPL
jgi:ATP-dependent protease ClpP protease subunit